MKVLYVTLYPLDKVKHGGMIRAKKIFDFIKDFSEVYNVPIFCPAHFPDSHIDENSIKISHDIYDEVVILKGKRPDLYLDELLTEDNRNKIRKILKEVQPDTIMFEQPWAWRVFKKELESIDLNPKIIYSSQNYELDLSENGDSEKVLQIEKDLVYAASSVICVTDKDKLRYEALGAKDIYICPNGVDPIPNEREFKQEYDFWKQKLGDKKVVLFVGSAHGPNVDGFMELLGPALGYLAPNSILVVVGEVHKLIEENYLFSVYRAINMERLCFSGIVDEKHMNALLTISDVIAVPILSGGGSNLKLAQALTSGKKVVCTSHALRGYEAYEENSRIVVADQADEFKSSIVEILNTVPKSFETEKNSDCASLFWENTLVELKKPLMV